MTVAPLPLFLTNNKMNMNILLVGSGGREHALAVALKKSNNINLFAAPGNPGIAEQAEIVSLNIKNHNEVVEFCKVNSIDLVVVGPEQPLADGLSDDLRSNSINVFGPSKQAAMLESSKDYAKSFMVKYGIPTAAYQTFDKGSIDEAVAYIENHSLPIVLKADGLAAGKGVIISQSHSEAIDALKSVFAGEFGSAGEKIVVEEFMQGQEASIFAVCDGNDYITLAPSQDHKRIFDNDEGKNTGGMGAYCPAKLVDDDLMQQVRTEIIDKALAGMKSEGSLYIGCLYVGLMIDNGIARVVEFNCRFGDPETQPVLTIFEGDFAGLLYSAAIGNIDKTKVVNIASKFATCVILASKGYPDAYETGFEISGLEKLPNGVQAYHSGTKLVDGKILSSGGRVLGITAIGSDLKESIDKAYLSISLINFDNMYFRKDIGKKGI